VDQIRYAAKEDQGVVTYPVILKVDNPDLKLRPGMTANVTIVTARRVNVLRMPAAALRFKPVDYRPERGNGGGANMDSTRTAPSGAMGDSTRWHRRQGGVDSTRVASADSAWLKPPVTVFTKSPAGKSEPRKVNIGLNDGTNVEIMAGDLAAGDSVIVGLAGTKTGATTTTMPPGMGGGAGRR
jgi:HlyD family secretion protein